jgi:hypothetical protein
MQLKQSLEVAPGPKVMKAISWKNHRISSDCLSRRQIQSMGLVNQVTNPQKWRDSPITLSDFAVILVHVQVPEKTFSVSREAVSLNQSARVISGVRSQSHQYASPIVLE